ncbi:MAG: Na+/H+ antiporter NhaA [Actinomycetia bacterium]|nr:Na+/H+ antiporter NhaA [Actinomycetes bacterium]
MGVWGLARRGVWRAPPYLVLAGIIWYAFYRSGVHPTLAGVLIALLMPVYGVRSQDVAAANEVARLYRQSPAPVTAATLREALAYSMPMNQRLSFFLPPYVNFLVVPLFALANAGVALSPQSLSTAFTSRITWAVIIGMVVGKFLGVTLGSALVLRWVPASRLPGVDVPRIMGIAALSGIGFTISLLVAGLALENEAARDQARIGVLCASLGALVLAALIFRIADRVSPLPPSPGQTLRREVNEHDLATGDPHAPHTLINYADMTYENRWRLMEALKGIAHLRDAGHVRLVLRHKLSGSESLLAALALEAARHQDESRLWRFHDALAELNGQVTAGTITRAAEETGLDSQALWKRIHSGEDEPKVLADDLDVEGLTDDASPVVYIDGERFEYLLNHWTFSEALAEREPQG